MRVCVTACCDRAAPELLSATWSDAENAKRKETFASDFRYFRDCDITTIAVQLAVVGNVRAVRVLCEREPRHLRPARLDIINSFPETVSPLDALANPTALVLTARRCAYTLLSCRPNPPRATTLRLAQDRPRAPPPPQLDPASYEVLLPRAQASTALTVNDKTWRMRLDWSELDDDADAAAPPALPEPFVDGRPR